MGITKDQIQVLTTYNPEKNLNPKFQMFIDKNHHLANFYTYPDLRENPKYTSSIRPNILKQHFEHYPELKDETLFYHDSDILFSRIPQIRDLEGNATCYVSDTRNYLDMQYIRRSSSEELLDDMLHIVGLSKEKLMQNNSHTGGAQYILKGITADFWDKIERDSEALFVLMRDYNTALWEKEYPIKKEYRSKKRGIQAWCADMWAVLWNLWLTDKKVEIHPEMDFSWPYSPLEEWENKSIQHYSGNIEDKDKFFKKTEYLNFMPWYDKNLLSIPNTSCSYKIIEFIQARKVELDQDRPSFLHSCIVFDGRELSVEQLENFALIQTYIQKHIAVDLYLLTEHTRTSDENTWVDTSNMLSLLEKKYKCVLCIPLGYVPDVHVMLGILSNRLNESCRISPKDIFRVDQLFIETFSKVLDMDLLHLNKGKFNIDSPSACRPIRFFNLAEDSTDRQQQLTDMLSYEGELDGKDMVTIPAAYNFIT
jgi:hypothetical protein